MLNQAIIIQDHDHKYLHYFKPQSANFTTEFVKVLPTHLYMLIQGLLTLGGLVLLIQRFISGGCSWIFITTKYNNINESISLYKFIGIAAANFFQEHIIYQFGILTKLQATNEALSIGVLLYQAVTIPRTLFKAMEVSHTLFKAVVVPRTTLLES